MRVIAIVNLHYKSKEQLEIAFKSLRPEIEKSPSIRSEADANIKDNDLILKIEATDTVALRATINAYLRWLLVINDVYTFLKNE